MEEQEPNLIDTFEKKLTLEEKIPSSGEDTASGNEAAQDRWEERLVLTNPHQCHEALEELFQKRVR